MSDLDGYRQRRRRPLGAPPGAFRRGVLARPVDHGGRPRDEAAIVECVGHDVGEPAVAVRHQRADIDAAVPADQEVGEPAAEAIAGERAFVGHPDGEPAGRVGQGARVVLAAERAVAGARHELRRRKVGGEGEADVAAMAAAFEHGHAAMLLRRRRTREGYPFVWITGMLVSGPVQPPVRFVDRIDRLVVADHGVRHDAADLVVEDQRAAAMLERHHRVRHAEIEVVEHDDAHVGGRKAERAQAHELGDAVILAVAVAPQELAGRGPVVGQVPVDRVEDIGLPVHLGVHGDDLRFRRLAGEAVEEGLPALQLATAEAARRARPMGQFGLLEVALQRALPFREAAGIVAAELARAEQAAWRLGARRHAGRCGGNAAADERERRPARQDRSGHGASMAPRRLESG